MRVFIAMYGEPYEGGSVLAVCSTLQKAHDIIEQYKTREGKATKGQWFSVEWYNVDGGLAE